MGKLVLIWLLLSVSYCCL